MPEDSDQYVHGADRVGSCQDDEGCRSQGLARAGAKLERRQRRIVRPPRCGRSSRDEETGKSGYSTEHVHPIACGVEPGKRHIGGSYLERNEIVRKGDSQRREEPEYHDQTMHRNGLVVLWRLKEGLRWEGELCPHEKCENPGQEGEVERCYQIENTNVLMVGCKQPPLQPDSIQAHTS